MIYLHGEVPVKKCSVGDVTIDNNHYVGVDAVDDNPPNVYYHELCDMHMTDLIQTLVHELDKANKHIQELTSRVEHLDHMHMQIGTVGATM